MSNMLCNKEIQGHFNLSQLLYQLAKRGRPRREKHLNRYRQTEKRFRMDQECTKERMKEPSSKAGTSIWQNLNASWLTFLNVSSWYNKQIGILLPHFSTSTRVTCTHVSERDYVKTPEIGQPHPFHNQTDKFHGVIEVQIPTSFNFVIKPEYAEMLQNTQEYNL